MTRRSLLHGSASLYFGLAMWGMRPVFAAEGRAGGNAPAGNTVTLFLGGDVMTGRGIDQVLPHPSDPHLYEPYMTDARGYVKLAERFSGPIGAPVGFDYIWGDALEVLERVRPDARVVNLETSITTSDEHWPGKGIHYRMHPRNVPCLAAAGLDCCVLANNHTLDWSRPGLVETLATLDAAGIARAGAGADLEEARRPATIDLSGAGRLLVFSAATRGSGTPPDWAATRGKSGVFGLERLDGSAAEALIGRIESEKQPGDLVVASMHWGGNWGYQVPREHREYARRLVAAGADVVHGHSSHHAKGIEVIDGRPVIYGCGDLINDYEGIRNGNSKFRGDLPLLYFPTLDRGGRLQSFRLKPMRIRKFRLQSATEEESEWLRDVLDREGRRFNTRVVDGEQGFLNLAWDDGASGEA